MSCSAAQQPCAHSPVSTEPHPTDKDQPCACTPDARAQSPRHSSASEGKGPLGLEGAGSCQARRRPGSRSCRPLGGWGGTQLFRNCADGDDTAVLSRHERAQAGTFCKAQREPPDMEGLLRGRADGARSWQGWKRRLDETRGKTTLSGAPGRAGELVSVPSTVQ